MGDNRSLLDHYVERYNAGDLETVMALYADDAVQMMPDGTFEGRSAIRARLARDLDACPDATYIVGNFVADGDTFADEWTFVGTQTGRFRLPNGTELPPSGNQVEIRGMELVQVRDGKIVVDNLYYDYLAVLVQLGLVPPNAALPEGAPA